MASRKGNTTVSLSAVTAKVAESRGIDTTKAGKKVRSYLRRHYATLEDDGYIGLSDAKSSANDGNRWPAMPKAYATKLVKAIG